MYCVLPNACRAGGKWSRLVHSAAVRAALDAHAAALFRVFRFYQVRGLFGHKGLALEAKGRFHLPCESTRSTLNSIWSCGLPLEAARAFPPPV
jgi:hypothetical protein